MCVEMMDEFSTACVGQDNLVESWSEVVVLEDFFPSSVMTCGTS